MVLELRGERGVGGVVFRRDDEAGGILVDPVNDSWSGYPIDPGQLSLTVPEHCIDQCTCIMSCRWMYNHSLWLIDHENTVILI